MPITDIIELTAIIVGAAFGVLGTITETKNEDKNLTPWGKIAVVGIVIISAFSIVDTYLKQQAKLREEIGKMKVEAIRIERQNLANSQQLKLQDSAIRLRQLFVGAFYIPILSKQDKIGIELETYHRAF